MAFKANTVRVHVHATTARRSLENPPDENLESVGGVFGSGLNVELRDLEKLL